VSGAALLEVRGAVKVYAEGGGLFARGRQVRAVDGVSFSVREGESFAVVGESGCGKTTLGKLILALERPTSGQVLFEGRDLFALPAAELRRTRRKLQVIFQDPYSSLNPRMTVRETLEEPFQIHGELPDPSARRARVLELLDAVGLARAHLDRHPHEFSGGQRQRVGIARALALNPRLVVADEAVSALDVSIQAQILNLLKDLQKRFRLTYVFISHDFSVVRHLCERVAVMYLGRLAETAPTAELFSDPQHPYTEALLSAIPVPDPDRARTRARIILAGDLPDPSRPPAGCPFHPRCRYAREDCRVNRPELEPAGPERAVACPPRPFRDAPSPAAIPERI
jgi:oligopeptide/dipeptide ABC transporter ATP-binding protein